MYFLRRLRPLEVAGERVRSLRLSLNAPVLSASDLPVGPARAAIVVHRDSRGRMDVTVGARSLRGGEVAYWSFDGELTSEDDLDVASDAALTFAESLGFLFDESPLDGGAAAHKAFHAWLAGDEAAAAGGRRDEAFDANGLDADLLLDDPIVDDPPKVVRPRLLAPAAKPEPTPPKLEPLPAQPEPLPVKPEPVPAKPEPALVKPDPAPAPPPPTPVRAPTLSKFRAREAEGEDEAAPSARPSRKAPARQPLARVQLVKRRSPEEERKLMLRRLLTSF